MDDPNETLENEEKSINRTEEIEAASEEDEGECLFCSFMKGGGCRETFTAWEECVKANKGDDVVEKCSEITGDLMECMKQHSDYYSPVLEAGKKREENGEEEGGVVSCDDGLKERSSSMEEEEGGSRGEEKTEGS